ncbi:MAG: DUF4349 domain-containing protein [Chloroflexi bacterium]|nr:DUF4349 domain-containing protein [Chloroflexota bacterium]
MFTLRSLSLLSLISFFAAACSTPGTPTMSGSYPQGSDSPSSSEYNSNIPNNTLVVYNAYMELEVSDTEYAARQAKQIAASQGGYLVSSRSWYSNGERWTTLTLAVPLARFDYVYQSLLRLGTLINDSVSGDRVKVDYESNPYNTFSNITLQLRPPAWNVGKGVSSWFATLWSFIVTLFWLAVAVTPLILMGIGGVTVMRWIASRVKK